MQASVSAKQVVGQRANDELTANLAGFVRFLQQAYGRNFFQVVGELELSLTQLKALHILEQEETSLKELGDRLGLSLPAISRAVEGLVQRGLVTRTEHEEDRRMKRVVVTNAGRDLTERLLELRIAGIEEFLTTLSEGERKKLAEALRPIAEREEIAPMCRRRERA